MAKEIKTTLGDSVHSVLAHSYLSYFVAFLVGLFLHFFYPIQIYNNVLVGYIGFVFLSLATLLIFWAQTTSRDLKIENLSKESFLHGPYCYTRMPTHLGLFLLLLGFGLVMNSLFVVLATLVYFIVGKFSFIKKQESLLLKKYGEHYLEYKKLVKF